MPCRVQNKLFMVQIRPSVLKHRRTGDRAISGPTRVVVRAETADKARDKAITALRRDEHFTVYSEQLWLDPNMVECVPLTVTGKSGVVAIQYSKDLRQWM